MRKVILTIALMVGFAALFLAMLRIYKRDYSEDPRQREALREQGVGSTRPLEPGTAPP